MNNTLLRQLINHNYNVSKSVLGLRCNKKQNRSNMDFSPPRLNNSNVLLPITLINHGFAVLSIFFLVDLKELMKRKTILCLK